MTDLQRIATTVCLVGGPLAAVAYELVTPVSGGDTNSAAQIAQAAAHPAAMNVALAFDGLALLLVPAVALAAGLARRGSPRLATVAGLVLFAGYLCSVVVDVGDGLTAAAASVANRAVAAAVVDAFWSNTLIFGMLLVYIVGHVAGMPLLSVAFWRSNVVPRWTAIGLGLAVPVEVLGRLALPQAEHWAGAAAYLLITIAFAVAAWKVLWPRATGVERLSDMSLAQP
jgi:hypothetical protein